MTALAVATLFAAGQAAAATALVNGGLMRLPGWKWKDPLMAVFLLLWIPGALAALWLGRATPTVQSFLALDPATPLAWALTGLFAGEISLLGWRLARSLRRRDERHSLRLQHTVVSRRVAAPPALRLPGLSLDRRDLHLTEIDLTLPRLPAALDGLRLLHLTDLHVEWAADVAHRALDAAEALAPDLVAVTGDFIVRRATPELERVLDRLAGLGAPLGVWCIRGNHDIWHDPEAATEALRRRGLPLLDNRAVAIDGGGAFVRLVGVEHPWNRVESWDRLLYRNGDSLCIALSHTPDHFPRLARAGVDLVLAGHTHGGQWRLPGVGSVIVPSRHGRRFDAGLFAHRGAHMWVSRGLGCVGLPVRLNCPPEITLITLRAPAGALEEDAALERAEA